MQIMMVSQILVERSCTTRLRLCTSIASLSQRRSPILKTDVSHVARRKSVQDEPNYKHGDPFRRVATDTLNAGKKRGWSAVGSRSATPTTLAYTNCDGGGCPDTGQTAEAREHSSRPSKILLWNGDAIECTLYDRSSAGARLNVGRLICIPTVFTLQIAPGEEQLPARLAWRKQDEI